MPLYKPQAFADAALVLANPAAYAHRPTLIQLAQLVTLSDLASATAQAQPRIGGSA